MSLPVVAIAGASGRTGKLTVEAFLSPQFRDRYKEVILLSRNSDYKVEGATVRTYSVDNVEEVLKGVDVVVNLVNHGLEMKKAIAKAVGASPTVKLYFPSEFGVDHMLGGGKDSDFGHIEWQKKKDHVELVHQSMAKGKDLKVCSVFVALMTEISFGPWFGIDTKNHKYECAGDPDQPASFTAFVDIGKALAVLASMAPAKLPEQVRVASDTVSYRQIAKIMEEAAGDGQKIEVTGLDTDAFKQHAFANPGDSPAVFIRFLMGNGKLDFSEKGLGNNNELINPGQKLWKWRTVKDYAAEVKGRPFCD